MSTSQIVTLVIAILGVLHGPIVANFLASLRKTPPSK
jgi:hypothetical protein